MSKIKHVRLLPVTNDVLDRLVEHRQKVTPHLRASKQSVVADLIVKAAKKEMGEK